MTFESNKPEALRRSEERYHKMVDELQDYAILLLSPQGTIENWNLGAEKIKGYKAEEVIGKNFRIFYTKEDRENEFPERMLHLASIRGKTSHEGWRVRKDGSYFWGNVVITALRDDKGDIIGFSKVTRDLTEQKKAESSRLQYTRELEKLNETLRRSENLYHTMVNEVEDYAIILLDSKGNIINWNKGAEKIKLYKAADIIGKNFRIFYTDEDRYVGLPEKLLAQAVENGKAFYEGWRVKKDGSWFWGSILLTALHDENRNLIGFTKVTRISLK